MDTGLLHLHNLLRWIILVLLLASVVIAFSGWQKKKPFTAGAKRIWLFTLIFSHLTLVLGLYQWLWGRYGMLKVSIPENASDNVRKFYRFFWIEHPTFMILAIILITLGYRMSKKPFPDVIKYKRAFWMFVVALLMILLAVPWPFREVVCRPWFPGMNPCY